ncbi:MAG: FMN-binding protein [Bacillota bacterium]|nr:FMN-binding protein [Bacillota bacterium]
MKGSAKEITAPIIVLVSICLVASFLLAGVYQITSPLIAEREQAAADAAKVAVLPQGGSFEENTSVEKVNGVENVYVAGNGAGVAIATNVKGMYAGLKLMIGIDSTGVVTGINVLANEETAGIGSKALDPSHLDKYIGVTAADAVDGISGATYTSNGIKNSVAAALEQFAKVK